MTLKQALDELSMALYAQQTDAWRGADLWQEIQQFNQQRSQAGNRRESSDLLSLYPDEG
jgi:hypothetical protein